MGAVQPIGGAYGASIWPDTALASQDTALTAVKELYFAMSTYNPYHVILMKTTVRLGVVPEE